VLFAPRRDKRRQSIASVHRHMIDRLRGAAICDLIAQGFIEDFSSNII